MSEKGLQLLSAMVYEGMTKANKDKRLMVLPAEDGKSDVAAYIGGKIVLRANGVILNHWKDPEHHIDGEYVPLPVDRIPESPMVVFVGRSDLGFFHSIREGALFDAFPFVVQDSNCLMVSKMDTKFYDTTTYKKRFGL